MKVAYFDSATGVSGDMFVGALLDAGASFEAVVGAVAALALPDIGVKAEKTRSHGLSATRFSVVQASTGRNAEEVEGDAHRGPDEMAAIIGKSALAPAVREHALAVVGLLAKAEAFVHGVALSEVHFHEVGAVDTLVDAVAASAAFVSLGIERAVASPVSVGGGVVKTMHGVVPVPAPATVELLRGAPVRHGGVDRELATPTGVALLRHFAERFGPVEEMTIFAAGYGAGRMEIGSPNVFRVVLGEK